MMTRIPKKPRAAHQYTTTGLRVPERDPQETQRKEESESEKIRTLGWK